MNGLEQRARFTAVSRAEKRLDDLELVLGKMAEETVRDRAQLAEDIDVFNERVRVHTEREALRIDTLCAALADRLGVLEQRTPWQRLRSLIWGA